MCGQTIVIYRVHEFNPVLDVLAECSYMYKNCEDIEYLY